jgi:hypothetical protein
VDPCTCTCTLPAKGEDDDRCPLGGNNGPPGGMFNGTSFNGTGVLVQVVGV